MFANDATMHGSSPTLTPIQDNMRKDIKSIQNWCTENKMKIIELKSNCMTVGSRQKLAKLSNRDIEIKVHSHILQNVTCEKLLGVQIDSNWDYNTHIDEVCKTITSKLSLLKQIKVFLSIAYRKLFYNACIQPSMDHFLVVRGNTSKCNLGSINNYKLQKYAARIILDAPYNSPSQPLFEKLDWLNIYERIEYSKGVLLFKSVHDLCLSYISELFTFQNSNVYSLGSASNFNMCLPRPNREIFKRTFQFSGVQIWNKLPTAVRSANTISSFKNLLVKHIKSKRTTNL